MILLRLLTLPAIIVTVCTGSNTNGTVYTTALLAHLFNGYDKRVSPQADASEPVQVKVSFALRQLLSFDDLTGEVEFLGNFHMVWDDKRIAWQPREWGEKVEIVLPKSDVWYPQMQMPMATNKLNVPGSSSDLIRFRYNGVASFRSIDLLSASCVVNVEDYPNDVQICRIVVYPAEYTSEELRFNHFRNSEVMSQENSEWLIENITTSAVEDHFDIYFQMRRRSDYILLTLQVPIMILGLLNPWVFCLSPHSGERVSYSITVLLSFTVYMGILTDHIPRGSKPIPLALYEVFIYFIYSAAILLSTIVSLYLHLHSDENPVPKWLQHVVKFLTCSFLRCVSKTQPEFDRSISLGSAHNGKTEHVNDKLEMHMKHFDTEIHDEALNEGKQQVSTSSHVKETTKMTWGYVGNVFDYYMLATFYLIFIVVIMVYNI